MEKISFCIATAKNELEYLKLLLKSFDNLKDKNNHEFIIFIVTDNQGTYEWLLTQKENFNDLKIIKNPIGIRLAQSIPNILFKLAKNDIVAHLHSDMIVCKNYDELVLKYLTKNNIVCATRVEPPLHSPSPEKYIYDCGLYPKNFNFDKFNEFVKNNSKNEIIDGYFAPFTLYKNNWLSIGGQDTLFRCSREDSDMIIRFKLNNTNSIYVKEIFVYHFTCVSSRGYDWFNKNNIESQKIVKIQELADSQELYKYIRKWGEFTHNIPSIYNIDAIINIKNTIDKNELFAKLVSIEPFFNKVYINDNNIVEELKVILNRNTNLAANLRWEMTDDDFEKYKNTFNIIDFNKRIFNADDFNPENSDIFIEFDLYNITNNSYINIIQKLNRIIAQYDNLEKGKYKIDIFTFNINNIYNRAMNQLIVSNPDLLNQYKFEII